MHVKPSADGGDRIPIEGGRIGGARAGGEPSQTGGATSLAFALHLFALSGFAIAQPLFDLLGRNPAFFISHHCQSRDILAFAAAILLGPPLILWSGYRVASRISPSLGRGVQWISVGALVSAVLLPPLEKLESLPATLLLLVALGLGTAVTFAYARDRRVRAFTGLLALAPLVFAASFIAASPASRLIFDRGGETIADPAVAARAPLVMVVFDELATTSLLARDGSIDAARFPAFAALAQDATFYRKTTAVHTGTIHAVPALLTGNYPVATRFPMLADHPRNLFTFLESSYRMRVVESETMLYRGNDPGADENGQTEGPRLLPMLSDARYVFLHILLPPQWTRALPSVSRTWKSFAEYPREADFAARARQTIWVGYDDPQARFESFIDAIEPCVERCLYFVHTTLPHQPWQTMPSGRLYSPRTTHGLTEKERWGENTWEVAEGYQQHLLQLGAADRLLGELVAQLKRQDLYDRALFVVAADHGVGFWPGESLRRLDGTRHPEDMIHVPLFIKAPGQRRGEVSDRRLQTIDLLPTIADLLDATLPWSVDGCSAQSPLCPERPKIIAYTQAHERLELEPELLDRSESLAHKLALFGDGDDPWPYRLQIPSLAPQWAGRAASEIGIEGEADYEVRLSELPIGMAMRDPATRSPARLSGHLRARVRAREPDSARPTVVVAIDGIVEAVVPAIEVGSETLRFSAFLPEHRLGVGRHELSIFLVSPRAGELRLAPALRYELEIPEVGAEAPHG